MKEDVRSDSRDPQITFCLLKLMYFEKRTVHLRVGKFT